MKVGLATVVVAFLNSGLSACKQRKEVSSIIDHVVEFKFNLARGSLEQLYTDNFHACSPISCLVNPEFTVNQLCLF